MCVVPLNKQWFKEPGLGNTEKHVLFWESHKPTAKIHKGPGWFCREGACFAQSFADWYDLGVLAVRNAYCLTPDLVPCRRGTVNG